MTSRAPSASVVVPAHDAEMTLRACVQSVLNQTEPDFELLIVDDGSSDGTLELARSVNDARVQVHTQLASGVSAARNAGIRAATGEIVCFLDSDDLLLPDTWKRFERTSPTIRASTSSTPTRGPSTIGPGAFAGRPRLTINGRRVRRPRLRCSCFVSSFSATSSSFRWPFDARRSSRPGCSTRRWPGPRTGTCGCVCCLPGIAHPKLPGRWGCGGSTNGRHHRTACECSVATSICSRSCSVNRISCPKTRTG
jgi:glycosyltransferase involved in cell wall biosynthesis